MVEYSVSNYRDRSNVFAFETPLRSKIEVTANSFRDIDSLFVLLMLGSSDLKLALAGGTAARLARTSLRNLKKLAIGMRTHLVC